jgi:hypothetical protein
MLTISIFIPVLLNFIFFVVDESFVSASLDGEIIVWSSNTLQPIKQFNEIREFEGDSHLYPYSVQHLFVLDQVRAGLYRLSPCPS